MHAIAAGAMTHALVRGCADGSLRNCRCDRELHGRALPDFPMWKWGGCSADLRHPIRLNRRFMETGSGSKVIGKVRAQDHIDRHNNMAGRLVSISLFLGQCLKIAAKSFSTVLSKVTYLVVLHL